MEMLTTKSHLNPFVVAAIVALFALCFCAGTQEGATSAFGDLLALKLPEQTDVAAKRINDRYYSLVDKKVATLSFKLTDSEVMAAIEKHRRTPQPTDPVVAEQLEKPQLLATYHLADGSWDSSLVNGPRLKKTFRDALEASWKEMLTGFWNDFVPHVTRLIDTKKDRITQMKLVKGDLVVTVFAGRGPAKTLVFDNSLRLKSVSGLSAKDNTPYRLSPVYGLYQGKYLVRSLRSDLPELHVAYDLRYQPLNGIMVLKEVRCSVAGSGEYAGLPPEMTMYFQDVQVTFGK